MMYLEQTTPHALQFPHTNSLAPTSSFPYQRLSSKYFQGKHNRVIPLPPAERYDPIRRILGWRLLSYLCED